MPDPQSDIEVLAQTAEWLSRLSGTIERVTDNVADRLAELNSRQNEQQDQIAALSNRIESVTRGLAALTERLDT